MISSLSFSQNPYDLWLQYDNIEEQHILETYKNQVSNIYFSSNSPTGTVIKEEIQKAFKGLLNIEPKFDSKIPNLIISTLDELDPSIKQKLPEISNINDEGYLIQHIQEKKNSKIIISAKTEKGLLYGVFNFIKQMQLRNDLSEIAIYDSPKIQKRLLNHWDNLDRSVERGYAGFSIWDWYLLPELIKQEYIDYARANASIGINGTVLTNVNSNALVLSPRYIQKLKALADVFRPYGIQVYLTARFSAPIETGDLETADPLNAEVRQWWKNKADEIYAAIPDFGGFLVKANSEGQPGPNNYGRSHVDGANMLAEAVAPHNGIIMWRAFVYSEEKPEDRAKQAYSEFKPFDGKFKDNVLVQVKNGAIDFQPREPFHPLFGAMPDTPLMMEFQITQEYLGGMSHLVFLPKLFEEVLEEDTYTEGEGSTVANIIDGQLSNKKLTGMAGVANIGTAKNWTGHPFGQANWYGFGRLAWDPETSAKTIAQDWLKMTFTNDSDFVDPMTKLLLESREAVVNYMTPLGLHHIMAANHHQGPGPWVKDMPRPDWTSVYYHKAAVDGIGFDRTSSGSNALEQYAPEIQKKYSDPATTPDKYLLWFHHLPWDYKMKSGKTLWYEIAAHYQKGVEQVEDMQKTWQTMKEYVNPQVFEKTNMLLNIQLKEAKQWRNACLLYFQQFSKMDFPDFIPEMTKDLNYYKSLKLPYAPGISPSWN
ncbi:MAG: alpha-glucuronidase [Zunongwangia sp.]|uniref:Xylan alpha-1,2-glucuronidase n=1 Tax=Zunongwangia profunda TaxID=398743 RepID=A0A3D5IXN4_9FLAO|nr:alpha-glucuronidase [Zunongwangia sp.]MAS72397.1 alpha-glucuronidase [Zunongwangia sp.]HAJ82683.1 alpha-glucuronidase [Zunongwangia profunda]HCV80443.1 alpha-glucuronidase [Zunongwangia profunda]